MTSQKNTKDLPSYNGQDMVSLLFLLSAEHAKVQQLTQSDSIPDTGVYIEFPLNAGALAFSDRPHSIAKPVDGGIK